MRFPLIVLLVWVAVSVPASLMLGLFIGGGADGEVPTPLDDQPLPMASLGPAQRGAAARRA